MERLTKRNEFGDIISNESIKPYPGCKAMHKRLAEYEDLEEQGLLHIAPCADGAVIWCIVHEGTMMFDDTVEYDNGMQLQNDIYLYGVTEYHFGKLGKDWFLTREEAEKALESSGSR